MLPGMLLPVDKTLALTTNNPNGLNAHTFIEEPRCSLLRDFRQHMENCEARKNERDWQQLL